MTAPKAIRTSGILVLVMMTGITYLLISTYGCEARGQYVQKVKIVNTSSLISNFFRNGGIITYPSNAYSGRLAEIAINLAARFRDGKLRAVPDTSLDEGEMENSNIIVLGSYHSNKILQHLNGRLPVKFEDGEFRFLNETYGKPSDLVNFIYPNPFNDHRSVIVISGNSDSSIAAHFSFNFFGSLRIRDGYETLLLTNFIESSGDKWKVDANGFWNFQSETDTILTTRHYTYITHSPRITRKEVERIAALNEKSVKSLRRLFEKSFKPIHIYYNLYDSFEEKGLIVDNTRVSSCHEPDESVHSVVNSYVKGDDFTQDALLDLRANYGRPKSKLLETGMSVYLGRSWRGFDYKFLASKLFLSRNVPSLSVLLDDKEAGYESGLVTQPLAGTFAAFMVQQFGITNLMKMYATWSPDKREVARMDRGWLGYLSKLSKSYVAKINEEKNNFLTNLPTFIKGFSFAQMGYDIYNGYLSGDSYNSLKELRRIGVNAISVMPFTYMRNPNEPEPLRFSQSAFDENDESVIFLEEAAAKLHFVVMLKPQIWLGRAWPGDIEMRSKTDWREFFKDYYRWIRHYALLAEMYRIPILCIGNELSKATVGHEKNWIGMVEHLRKLYDGKITYGANWDNEFRRLTFWRHFDYIGISEYYPLSKKDNPSNEELQEGADSVIDLVHSVQKKYGRPVMFTEIGYRSSMYPWKTALEKDPRPDTTLLNQARCYKAMMKASYGKKWLAGMFWWKWPSYLGYPDYKGRSLYLPLNKPAENVVREWYSKIWNNR